MGQQQVYVSKLSGGEKRRLHLLNILEDFLMDFPGCVLVVTHDRFFMDKIVDHLFIFEGDGKIRDYNGQYSDYRVLHKEELEEARQAERDRQKRIIKPTNEKLKDEKPKLSYEERKEFNRLEKQISVLEEKKEKITEQFNNPNLTPAH